MNPAQILALLTTLVSDYGSLEAGKPVSVNVPLNGAIQIVVPGVGTLELNAVVTVVKK